MRYSQVSRHAGPISLFLLWQCGSLLAQVPATLTLDHVDMTSKSVDTSLVDTVTVDPPAKSIAGNSFTATLGYTYNGKGGTASFTMGLPSAAFTDSGISGSGVTLSPKAVFQYTASIIDSRAGIAQGAGLISSENLFNIVDRCVFAVPTAEPQVGIFGPSGPCTLDPLAYDNSTRLVKVHVEFYNQVFQVTMDAYYTFEQGSLCETPSLVSVARRMPRGAVPQDGAGCSDFISFVDGGVFPAAGEIILANGDNKTTPFFALAKYSLNSQQAGKVLLQVFDQSGKYLTQGPPVLATPGTQIAGSSLNCVGPNMAGYCLYAPAASYPDGTTAVSLVAFLEDSNGKVLAKSDAISYPVTLPTATLTLGSQPLNQPFTPAPANTVVEGGSTFEYSVDSTALQASYNYPGQSAWLSVLVQTDQSPIGRTLPQMISKGAGTVLFNIASMKVPSRGSVVVFAPIWETSTGQTYQGPPTTIPMETIYRSGPATPPDDTVKNGTVTLAPDPDHPGNSLPINFSYPVTYRVGPAGALLTEELTGYVLERPATKVPLTAGPGQTTVSFTTSVRLAEYRHVSATADLSRPDGSCPCAHADEVFWNSFQIAVSLPPGPSTNVPAAAASISPTQNTTTQNVTSSTSATDPNADIGEFKTFSKLKPAPHALTAASGSPSIPDFISVHRTWYFTPPIPADGSFAANLTLYYSADDLPDDPNFDESQLQMVSYNPSTGVFATYPTTVDLTNKTATAQVPSLEPIYSLVNLGPFSKVMLNAPYYVLSNGFTTMASLVNTGNTDVHLNINGYGQDGTAVSSSPAAVTVPANQPLIGTIDSLGLGASAAGTSGWAQTSVDNSTLSGVVTAGNGTLFEALPMSAGHFLSSVVTDIEFDDTFSTEIHVVNPATNPRNFTIDLRNPDGTSAGTYSDLLGAKSTSMYHIEDLFPTLQKPFIGYAMVSGDGDVLASALLFSYATLSAASGHPLNALATGGTTLYGPQLGAARQFTRLILVNAGPTDANLTFNANRANGSAVGSGVSQVLPAGQQLVADLAQLFGFDPANPLAGSFTVTSDQPSVFGDLVFGDASLQQLTRASVPLTDTPVASAILPIVQNDGTAATVVNVSNPNSLPASITATVFDSGGSQVGQATVSVPANGASSTTLSSLVPAAAGLPTGYVTVGATQPVVTFGVIAPATGSDFASVPAQPIASAPMGPPALPQISVTPTSFDFQSVPLGQSKTQTFTIGNNGTGPLSVTSLALDATEFTIVSPAVSAAAPLAVAAGQSASVTVQFKPDSAKNFSGNLTISSNDPANPSLLVRLSGTGVSSTGNPQINVNPTSLNFGSVPVGLTSTMSLKITNQGTGTLTVTSLSLPNGAFTLVSLPAVPFNVTAAGQILTVRFAPTAAGVQSSGFSIGSNASATPVAVTLTGTGVGPAISVSPSSLSFGNVTTGQTPTLNLTISNTGGGTLTVSSLSSLSAPFSLVAPPSTPFNVPSGGTTLTVRFAPTSAIASSATLSITSNGSSSPVQVALTGTGAAAAGNGSGNIISLKLEAGAYSATSGFTGGLGTWDTDTTQQFWILGVTNSGSYSNPLLNKSDRSVNLPVPPNTYFLYASPYNLGSDMRVTVGWSNGATDIAIFHVGSTNDGTVWQREGSTGADLSLTYLNPPGNVCKVFQYAAASGCSASSYIFQLTIAGAGTATGGITVSPASLDFGSVTVGQTSPVKTVTVTNTGPAAVTVSLLTSAPFAVSPATLTLAANGGSGIASLTFKPTSTASSGSALYVTAAGQSTPAATVALTGSGASAGTVQTYQLFVDSGNFDQLSGFPDGAATAYFVNRLTPPSYPATLRSVQIAFFNQPVCLPLGSTITVVSGANASGSANINFISLASAAATVATLDALNSYAVAPITITSGDFVVGFWVQNSPGIYPMVEDTLSGSKQRSYVSPDGVNFALVDTIGLAGNYGIRATVDVAGSVSNASPVTVEVTFGGRK